MLSIKTAILIAVLMLTLAQTSNAKIHRDPHARTEFKHQQPCPSTGKKTGACKGWVIDHIKPLACGGADAPSNMQWQTVADAKAKDKWERKDCQFKKR